MASYSYAGFPMHARPLNEITVAYCLKDWAHIIETLGYNWK